MSNSQLIQTQRLFLSALILALTSFPALLSSLAVLGEEAYGHLHTLISEPVKPEWRVHAAAAEHKQPQLTTSVHFFFLQAHTSLKGNDATLFAVFKPFIFVVVCFFVFKFFST